MFNLSSKVLTGLLGGSLLISVALGGALAWSRHELSNAKEVIQSLVEWQDGIIETTRLAAGPDVRVTKENAQTTIQVLGHYRLAVLSQNRAIEALEEETKLAQEARVKAEKQYAAALQRAETLRKELRQRAETPVAPEDQDAAIRRSQDDLYEAGF